MLQMRRPDLWGMTHNDSSVQTRERMTLPESNSERISGMLPNFVAFTFVDFEAPSSVREMDVSESREKRRFDNDHSVCEGTRMIGTTGRYTHYRAFYGRRWGV